MQRSRLLSGKRPTIKLSRLPVLTHFRLANFLPLFCPRCFPRPRPPSPRADLTSRSSTTSAPSSVLDLLSDFPEPSAASSSSAPAVEVGTAPAGAWVRGRTYLVDGREGRQRAQDQPTLFPRIAVRSELANVLCLDVSEARPLALDGSGHSARLLKIGGAGGRT